MSDPNEPRDPWKPPGSPFPPPATYSPPARAPLEQTAGITPAHRRRQRSWWARRSTGVKIAILAGGLALLGLSAGAALIPTTSSDRSGGVASEGPLAPATGGATPDAIEPAPTESSSPTPDTTSAQRAPASATPRPRPSSTTASRPSTDPRYDNCKEARSHGYGPYYEGVDPEYDWYRDPNRDGVVCN